MRKIGFVDQVAEEVKAFDFDNECFIALPHSLLILPQRKLSHPSIRVWSEYACVIATAFGLREPTVGARWDAWVTCWMWHHDEMPRCHLAFLCS
jgi:hypothetical protein